MDRVDRIVFAHNRTLDFQPLASSFVGSEEERWAELLRGHVRVQHERRPRTSMWYWNDETMAAVLWRIADTGDGRSDRCHGLVGPAHVLDTAAAVALNTWSKWDNDEWNAQDGLLAPANPHEIRNLPATTYEQSVPADCFDTLYEFLAKPEEPLSLITDRSPATRLYLLSDLLAILGPVVGSDLLTFSTFEARHDSGVAQLPWLIFLPVDREEHFNYRVARTVIELATVPKPRKKQLENAVNKILSEYRTLGRLRFKKWMDALHLPVNTDTATRVAALLDCLRGTRDASRTPPPYQSAVVDQPPTDIQLLEMLRTASGQARTSVLAEIRKRGTASATDRREILRLLLEDPQWSDSFRTTPTDELDTLVSFAIDRTDWSDPSFVHAVNHGIGALTSPPQLSVALIRLAVRDQKRQQVVHGVAMKQLRDLGHPERDLIGPPPQPANPASDPALSQSQLATRQHRTVETMAPRQKVSAARVSSQRTPRLRLSGPIPALLVATLVILVIIILIVS